MRRFRARRNADRGFTLVEVLLVLALMAVISSFAWASLRGTLARQRLKSAVDNVRSEWCAARVDAMKSGHTYSFRYQIHGSRFHLGPQDDASSSDNPAAAPAPGGQSAPSSQDSADDEPMPRPVDGALPQGVCFLPGDGELASMGDKPQTGTVNSGEGWSDPILFYADGSTSDASLLLASDRHSAMRVMLRGMTGTVTINDRLAAAE
jgi:type II secretion system protein H